MVEKVMVANIKELERLVRLQTYARMKGVSYTCVSKWIEQGKIESVKIDGVKFVVLAKEELSKLNKEMSKQ